MQIFLSGHLWLICKNGSSLLHVQLYQYMCVLMQTSTRFRELEWMESSKAQVTLYHLKRDHRIMYMFASNGIKSLRNAFRMFLYLFYYDNPFHSQCIRFGICLEITFIVFGDRNCRSTNLFQEYIPVYANRESLNIYIHIKILSP